MRQLITLSEETARNQSVNTIRDTGIVSQVLILSALFAHTVWPGLGFFRKKPIFSRTEKNGKNHGKNTPRKKTANPGYGTCMCQIY